MRAPGAVPPVIIRPPAWGCLSWLSILLARGRKSGHYPRIIEVASMSIATI